MYAEPFTYIPYDDSRFKSNTNAPIKYPGLLAPPPAKSILN